MHPAVKALIAWCVAGYAAVFVRDILQHAFFGSIGSLFAFPGIIATLIRCAMRIPFATVWCLAVLVLAVLIRMGLRRFLSGVRAPVGVSFVLATVVIIPLTVWSGWGQMREGLISPAEFLVQAVVLGAPYGLAAFGVYWTVYRDPAQPDLTKVF
ncbi:hypothetical protein [Asticcacaulis solisilvae]|uniref:hypothetical protein n=1 Tax=Asticcacaulis solisilvae TaxID=1217274 RepID=UPI003FD6D856